MPLNVRANLRAINSLTKYPPITTYHQLDPSNGGLLDEAVMMGGCVIGTEKVDGTNSRIIVLPDGDYYLIGSREELLYGRGDMIGNPTLGIVDSLRGVAETLPGDETTGDAIRVYYLELFGGRIGSQAKQYSTRGAVGWRLFDIARIDGAAEKMDWPAERISRWRDNGGQEFASEHVLNLAATITGIQPTPRLFTMDAGDLPTDLEKTLAFLREHLPSTRVQLDDSGQGHAEGIVLRTPDRSVIAKARFQDYERTLRRRRS